jgi:hypothetical protein
MQVCEDEQPGENRFPFQVSARRLRPEKVFCPGTAAFVAKEIYDHAKISFE